MECLRLLPVRFRHNAANQDNPECLGVPGELVLGVGVVERDDCLPARFACLLKNLPVSDSLKNVPADYQNENSSESCKSSNAVKEFIVLTFLSLFVLCTSIEVLKKTVNNITVFSEKLRMITVLLLPLTWNSSRV